SNYPTPQRLIPHALEHCRKDAQPNQHEHEQPVPLDQHPQASCTRSSFQPDSQSLRCSLNDRSRAWFFSQSSIDVVERARVARRGGSTLKGGKVPPKYRSPSGETWAGRGAKPRWLVAAMKGGKKLDDFLIDKSARKGKRRSKR